MNKRIERPLKPRHVVIAIWICAVLVAILCAIGERISPQNGMLIRNLPIISGILLGTAIAILYWMHVLRERRKPMPARVEAGKRLAGGFHEFLSDIKKQDWAQLETFVKIADKMRSSDVKKQLLTSYLTDEVLAAAAKNSIDAIRGESLKSTTINDRQIRELSIAFHRPLPVSG